MGGFGIELSMTPELLDALKEYRIAYAEAPRCGECGWMDDFQKRAARLRAAGLRLLEVAAQGVIE